MGAPLQSPEQQLPPGTFPVTYSSYRGLYLIMVGLLLLSPLAAVAVHSGLLDELSWVTDWLGVPVFLFAIVAFYFMMRSMKPRQGTLALRGGQLVLDRGGRTKALPFDGLQIACGRWEYQGTGAFGAIVALRTSGGTLRIGVRDLLLPDAGAYTLPPGYKMDCCLELERFQPFLGALEREAARPGLAAALSGGGPEAEGAPFRAQPSPRPAFRLDLMPNQAAPGYSFKLILSIMSGIILFGAAMSGLMLFVPDPSATVGGVPIAPVVMVPLTLAFFVGLAFFINSRSKKGAQVALSEGVLTLSDRRGRPRAQAPLDQVSVTAGLHVWTARYVGEQRNVVMAITIPGVSKPLTVGTQDVRFRWAQPERAEKAKAPRWVLGGPEWRLLAEAVGLGGRFVVDKGLEAAQTARF